MTSLTSSVEPRRSSSCCRAAMSTVSAFTCTEFRLRQAASIRYETSCYGPRTPRARLLPATATRQRYDRRATSARTTSARLHGSRKTFESQSRRSCNHCIRKKRSEETQTLRAGCSKVEPKMFAPPQAPSRGRGTAKI